MNSCPWFKRCRSFTVNPDHERQMQVWDQIRRMLTETPIRASERCAVFVGVEDYEAAGGIMLQDLFHKDDGG